jgi:hypothetical protein
MAYLFKKRVYDVGTSCKNTRPGNKKNDELTKKNHKKIHGLQAMALRPSLLQAATPTYLAFRLKPRLYSYD